MRTLIFLGYVVLVGALLFAHAAMFLPGLVLAAPGLYLIGRTRAEFGRLHADLRQAFRRRTEYRD